MEPSQALRAILLILLFSQSVECRPVKGKNAQTHSAIVRAMLGATKLQRVSISEFTSLLYFGFLTWDVKRNNLGVDT